MTHTHSRRAETWPESAQKFSTEEIAKAMQIAGIPPDLVYGFRMTGFIPTEATLDLLSDEQLAEWDAAIADYDRTHAKKKGAGA